MVKVHTTKLPKVKKKQNKKRTELGNHIALEFYGCEKENISNDQKINKIMIEAAKRANATIITSNFHYFEPFGVSGVVIIKESHLAIHTWPEHSYAAIDIYTCGDIEIKKAYEYLKDSFKPIKVKKTKIGRGKLDLITKYEKKRAGSDKKKRKNEKK